MTLLILFASIALVFSFLCSVAEAVLLSVTTSHIAVMEKKGRPSAPLLRELKKDINRPLAAILTLNTIAHTVGAAGAGAQAAKVFGDAYLGIASAILTLLILVLSEIIPKTLGAVYWKRLAPVTAYSLRVLVWILYPFVLLSQLLTRGMGHGPTLTGFNRAEFEALAELSARDGHLAEHESRILLNVLNLQAIDVTDVMTPRPVIFSLPQDFTVAGFFENHQGDRFTRVPIYDGEPHKVTGFVLRSDLLLAQARGNGDKPLSTYRRDLLSVLSPLSISRALELMLQKRVHMMLVVDEYGGVLGLLTMEDLVETVLGIEIIDEEDKAADMQQLARKLWRRRAAEMGIPESGESG